MTASGQDLNDEEPGSRSDSRLLLNQQNGTFISCVGIDRVDYIVDTFQLVEYRLVSALQLTCSHVGQGGHLVFCFYFLLLLVKLSSCFEQLLKGRVAHLRLYDSDFTCDCKRAIHRTCRARCSLSARPARYQLAKLPGSGPLKDLIMCGALIM